MTQYIYSTSDPNVIQELRDAIQSSKCVLFAGSGLSAQAETSDGKHPPMWVGLLKAIAQWCEHDRLIEATQVADMFELVDRGYLLEAGQEIEDIFLESKPKLQQCLKEVLLFKEALISDAHELIAKIRFRAYLTTNYDTLIETAYSLVWRRPLAQFYEGSIKSVLQEYRQENPFILKLHGDVNNWNSIVLGERAYGRLLHDANNYRDSLHSIFSTSSILFIGFGATDPDLNSILNKVATFDGPFPRHWIVVPEGHFPALKAKRLWKDQGINVIQYTRDTTHAELVRFLEKLATPPALAQEPDVGSNEIRTKLESLGGS